MGVRTIATLCGLPFLVLLAGGRPLASFEVALFYAGFVLPALSPKARPTFDSLAAALVCVPFFALASLRDEPGTCAWPAAAGLVFLTALFASSARDKLGPLGPGVSAVFFALPPLVGYLALDVSGKESSIGAVSPYWAVAAGTSAAGISALALVLATGALLALPAPRRLTAGPGAI